MIRRYSLPISLAAAVVVFVAFFFGLAGAEVLLRLGLPALLAAGAAVGVWVMTRPSKRELIIEEYRDNARGKVQEARDLVRALSTAAIKVHNRQMRAAIDQSVRTVPELLRRVEAQSPDTLYSSAGQMALHLESLVGVVEKYADIEKHPKYYANPKELMASGETAAQRFAEFTLDSIRLINHGDLAEYQANLATVTPPSLPELEDRL
ncbi:5-bromo-4-chloroindolyl phosphate hydrolysis family protein [Enemella sp. A6]|uniref:5-bromo-4-chloroindolyl phosphate hydrolysis family protein n=1 Tax=Enemella sp. A6 TaxID=3440152 RepID=UPI003EB7742F